MSTSGHDEIWVDETKAKEIGVCPICACVPRDAVAHICGNLFCYSCWQCWHQEGKNCSLCREPSDASPAYKDRRSILDLRLHCPLACGKIISLANKSVHLESECTHRTITCTRCNEDTTPAGQEQHDRDECNYRCICCPSCDCQTTPNDLQRHQANDCVNRMVSCMCGEQCKQADLEQHVHASAGKHVLLLTDLVCKLKEENDALKAEIHSLKNPAQTDDSNRESSASGRMWHPGRIGAAPNGIGRTDGEEIIWSRYVQEDEDQTIGYTWHNFREGWRDPLEKIYEPHGDNKCLWTCCKRPWDASPCEREMPRVQCSLLSVGP